MNKTAKNVTAINIVHRKIILAIKKVLVLKLLFTLTLILSGCTREQNYRGVPSPVWEHLTAEQKQLIVDRAYQEEMK